MPEAAASCRFQEKSREQSPRNFLKNMRLGQTGPFRASLTVISQRIILGLIIGVIA
jgi:hypothetical protein